MSIFQRLLSPLSRHIRRAQQREANPRVIVVRLDGQAMEDIIQRQIEQAFADFCEGPIPPFNEPPSGVTPC